MVFCLLLPLFPFPPSSSHPPPLSPPPPPSLIPLLLFLSLPSSPPFHSSSLLLSLSSLPSHLLLLQTSGVQSIRLCPARASGSAPVASGEPGLPPHAGRHDVQWVDVPGCGVWHQCGLPGAGMAPLRVRYDHSCFRQ